ncbi:hypothetical protein J7384_10840 [Endozoicomonas sp. G2_1]|uniref:hypothetical protein n=1 Tax=Endozoicomonas sp. G2_1 TaxID=2821091 RepID=UPI001ADC4E88|nr:hypothetical protein [Endozoicomonas sp. G2_1]MBO9490853.1 hypothetical protein [Endozoicomonas sp. G2_1]
MRTIQFLGLISAVFAVISLYVLLSPITPDSSASSASAVGLALMFIVAPAFGFSALLLIPSSIALINSKLREKTYFNGKFWYSIWGINSILCLGYVIAAVYIGYLYLTSSTGN